MAVSPARLTAFRILERVEQGAWASDLLAAHTQALDSRDAGLATELVLGVLRRRLQLDWFIETQTGGRKLDTAVRTALRMGAYQVRFLDRIPPHAAVTESVELVRRARKHSAAGLVNAVLRRIPAIQPVWPSRDVELSMPEWILDRWDAQFGPVKTAAIARAFLSPPETWVRHPPADADVEPSDVPGAYRSRSGSTAGMHLQDIGSQSVVPLLELQPGMTFLDLCAAPGNKTAQALETGVRAVARDIHRHRLRTVSGCLRVALDATRPLPFHGTFDRVLVDAPCSGTGTLGRNLEIRWKLRPEDIRELQQKQIAILEHALHQVGADGRLVYSTCSLEREENEEVVRAVSAQRPVRMVSEHRRTPGVDPGDGFYAVVIQR